MSDNTVELDRQLDLARDENLSIIENLEHDKFRTPLFEFVRYLRSIPALKDVSAAKALQIVEAWLSRKCYGSVDEAWLAQFALVGITSAEDARMEFLDLWDRIRFPRGSSPLQAALDLAGIFRLRPNHCGTEGYVRFISLAGNLQRLRGSDTILLPCREVGELLEVSAHTISRYRRRAIQHGQLRQVHPHFFSDSSRAATEFRFDLSRYPSTWKRGVTDENAPANGAAQSGRGIQ